jgi:hypothetical protein
MDEIVLKSFWDELEKISYSMANIERDLARSKGLIQKLKPNVSLMQVGPAAFHGDAVRKVQIPHLRAAALAGQVPEQQAAGIERLLGQVSGKITMPQRTGGAVGQMRGMGLPGAAAVQGKSRKAAEAIMRAHEMDEMARSAKAASNPTFATKMTHTHPDVLLREHNRITTLPEGVKEPVQGLFQNLRGGLEQPVFNQATRGVGGQGLQLTQSPRLSRHARRHISDRMQQLVAEPTFPTIAERMAAQ